MKRTGACQDPLQAVDDAVSVCALLVMRLMRSIIVPPETVSDPAGLAVAPPSEDASLWASTTSCAEGDIVWRVCKSVLYAAVPISPRTRRTNAAVVEAAEEAVAACVSTGAIELKIAACAALACAAQELASEVAAAEAVFAAFAIVFHAEVYCVSRFDIVTSAPVAVDAP